MPEMKEATLSDQKDELLSEIERLQAKVSELKRDTYCLQMQKDILEKAAEIVKKDPGINLKNLSNREKTALVDALRRKYPLSNLFLQVKIARSTYYYEHRILTMPDKYADLRKHIYDLFYDLKSRYGYRRIHAVLKNEAIIVSEKVVRRLMYEMGLIVPHKTMRKYNSYKGEITPAVPNLIERNFHADAPNKKWLTDITEFSIPAGKVYLSPIVDCFDGALPSWTISTSPNAELVNTMLDNGIASLEEGDAPIIHSDRGCHYRWPGWIARTDEAGLSRSMSRKGCSPDNSACEGLFGRIKNELFYFRDWKNVTIDEFIMVLNDYLIWYNEKRIKETLGWRSPLQYRQSLGYSM